MLRRFVAVAAVIAFTAHAQVVGDLDGVEGPISSIGVGVLSLPFSTIGCFPSGTVGGTMNEPVSITRATSATYESAPGVISSCAAGSYRIDTNGLLVETARTNILLNSGTPTSGTAIGTSWSSVGTPTFSTQGAGPDGVSTWGRITSTTVADVIYQIRTVTSTTTAVASAWARADTGTDTVSVQMSCQSGTLVSCTCARSDGGACTPRPGVTLAYHCTADFTAITTTPVRLWTMATCSAAVTSIAFAFMPGSYSAATGTADFTMAQLEAGIDPTSYIRTVSTAVTRNADVVTVPTPAGLSGSNYCVRGDYYRNWSSTRQTEFWGAGTVGAANTLRFAQISESLSLDVFDPAATQRRGAATSGLTGYQRANAMSCNNGNGTFSIYVNDVLRTTTMTLGGTGNMTAWPATLNLGDIANNDTAILEGSIRNFKVCRTSNPARCR